MAFNPESISPRVLQDLRDAAERAYGEDTRHESFQGHPCASLGHCYVASEWLKSKLGGHVGTKKGHFFWVSPGKKYVIDLTGDKDVLPPEPDGQVDEDGDPVILSPHHKTWRSGPVLYKQSSHPRYRDFRIVDAHGADDRVRRFSQRADAALAGKTVHQADLLGADPYPAETPQSISDYDNSSPLGPVVHDEPDYDPSSTRNDYQFVFANGQVHVSPIHDHSQLLGHAGSKGDGPVAVGYVEVNQGHALWAVESNIGLRGLGDVLKDYSDNVGWKWEGMTNTKGEMLSDDFGSKKSMWYKERSDGHLVMSEKPLPHGQRVHIEGHNARVAKVTPALEEWANDFGYKLAEFPGGGNMVDMIKVRPNDDLNNNVDQDYSPEKDDVDIGLHGDLKCGTCGKSFPTTNDLILHRRDHDMETEDRLEDGHFPYPPVFRQEQQNPGFGTIPVPNGGNTIAKTMTLGTLPHGVTRFEGRPMWQVMASNTAHNRIYYGAYHAGAMIGYAMTTEWRDKTYVVDMHSYAKFADDALLGLIAAQHPDFEIMAGMTHKTASDLSALGLVNTHNDRFSAAQGQEPKDMIAESIPFIYDINGDKDNKMGKISLGYAGQQTHDVQPAPGGRFTPGGIVEGYYEPGGKVVFVSSSNAPYTVRGFATLWYSQFPQMEITSVEMEGPDGKTQKLAANNVGQVIRSLTQSDQAAQGAYQALKFAGGKCYVVGGAVRDVLQGRDPKDIDMMVAGIPPEQVDHILSQLPGRVDLTGKRFGVYRYRVNGQEVEIALPRQDKYETSRRGEGVITVDHSLPVEKDLQRRDFTANSMAVDLDSGALVDPYNGAQDIENNVLRTTHPDSFREDPTRLIRALTAHSRFGLNPDEKTLHEMEENAHLLAHESPDATNKILDKLFASGNPASAIRLAHSTGVLKHIFPEVEDAWDFDQNNPHHKYPLGEHLMNVLDNTSRITGDPDVRLAALMHDVGKPASEWKDPVTGKSHFYHNFETGEGADHDKVGGAMTEQRMRALNYPTARINRVKHLIDNHMFPAFSTARGARKFLQRVGDNHADDLLNLREADQTGKGQSPAELAEKTAIDQQRQLVDEARKNQAPTDVSNLAINGNDLIQMGMQPGPQIGQTLRNLLDHVVGTPDDNNRDRLLQVAQGFQ